MSLFRFFRRPSWLAWAGLISLSTLGLSGCEKYAAPEEVLRPAYGTLEEMFQTEIVGIGLERLGYRVLTGSELEYDIIHEAIAKNYLDYTTVHWHYNHADFFKANGGDAKMVRAGTLVENAVQGYLIDRKTAQKYNITNIEQLKDPAIARLFDTDGDGKANLVGCNVGWACRDITEYHLDAYGLRDTVSFDSDNYFGLIDEVIKSHAAGKSILYYAWTPLWLNFVLVPGKDVEWLEVPYTALPDGQSDEVPTTLDGKNLGFAVDRLEIVANREFAARNPKAEKFFEQVKIPAEAISLENQKMHNGENTPAAIRGHAEAWVAENQKEFDGWVKAARKE